MENPSNGNVVTVAGWTTYLSGPTFLLFLHPIPRPYSYWMQLRADARGYKPWLYWIGGGGLIVLGVVLLYLLPPEPGWTSPWLALASIFFGANVLLSWLYKFYNVVRWTRTEPLGVGVIRTVKPHPVWRDLGFADAVQADGTVVNVVVPRAFVHDVLVRFGQCEVLFRRRPWSLALAETGVVIAARLALYEHATAPLEHWTGLNQAKRLELEQIATRVDYPIDAVFFILSALYAVARRQLAAEPMGRHGDLHGGVRNVTAQELCRFIPEHAASMFGGATRASEVLSALGLRTSEDVGAIIRGYVDAGWLKPSPASGDDDYTGIDIGVASHRGLWSRFWPSYRRWRQPPYRPPATAMGKFRALLLMIGRGFCVGFGLSAVIVPGYVLWAERLTFEERPLVGRWYTMGEKKGEELKLIELRTDRLCEFQTLRLGQDTIPAGQSLSVRWAAREGRIVLTPPLRGYQDRAARAFGRGPIGLPGEIAFHTPDADTLEISRVGGPRVVYRRVPGGLASYAELFPPRQAGQ